VLALNGIDVVGGACDPLEAASSPLIGSGDFTVEIIPSFTENRPSQAILLFARALLATLLPYVAQQRKAR